MIKLIAAVSQNKVIGNDNDLVLTHKEDFEHFKNLTKGNVVLMGRKTWESLPKKSQPLPNRVNYVVSKCEKTSLICLIGYLEANDGKVVGYIDKKFKNVEDLLNHVRNKYLDKTIFIIGGGMLYKTTIHLANELIITHWSKSVSGNIFFPEIDENMWERKFIKYPATTNEFSFETWIKK